MVRRSGQHSDHKSQESNTPSSQHHLIFWGVRGTIPVVGATTAKYGGNTSCVEVRCFEQDSTTSLVLDAGSGIVEYGNWALSRGMRKFNILLSHVHYDHIMGLTRFAPIFRKDCEIHFFGGRSTGMGLAQIIEKFFAHPFFPVSFRELGATLSFTDVDQGSQVKIGDLEVGFLRLNHPNGALASRISCTKSRASVVYCTDHEHGTAVDRGLVDFARDATVFLYDTTFSEAVYQTSRGWGHSTPANGARLAAEAKVRAFGLFHHEPNTSDLDLDSVLLPEALEQFPDCFISREGFFIDLNQLHNGFRRADGRRVTDLLSLASL